jgi:hypothetical protein
MHRMTSNANWAFQEEEQFRFAKRLARFLGICDNGAPGLRAYQDAFCVPPRKGNSPGVTGNEQH